jgi:hypothetical protein
MPAARGAEARKAGLIEQCGSCVHFRNDPAYLEAVFPGLTSLSSGYASVRADDGLCARHELYLSAGAWCRDHVRRGGNDLA